MLKKIFLPIIDLIVISTLYIHLVTDNEHKFFIWTLASGVWVYFAVIAFWDSKWSLGPCGLTVGVYTYFKEKQTQRRLLDKIDQLHEELIKLTNTYRVDVVNIQELKNLLIDLELLQYQLNSSKSASEAFKKFESLYLEEHVLPEEFIEKLQRNLCMRTLFLQSKRLKPLSPKSEGGIRLFETST